MPLDTLSANSEIVPVGAIEVEKPVADAVRGDRCADVVGKARDVRPLEIGVGIEQRKRALLLSELRRCAVRLVAHDLKPAFDQRETFGRAVARAAEDQRIREPGDAEPDPALGLGFGCLRLQRKTRDVDHVIEEAHRDAGELRELGFVEPRFVRKRMIDELGEIDRAQEARAIGRQRLLAARVGRLDRLAIGEVVQRVHPVDEDHAGLGRVVGRAHDAVPQPTRGDGLVDLAVEDEVPRLIGFDLRHERIADEHREIEIAQPLGRAFGVDEFFDVRMRAGERAHHRAAPGTRRHDRPAHRVPDVHERDRARRIRADALHFGALGSQRGEVVADAAALLHRERGLAQMGEDAREVIGDRAHDETVEQRDRAPRARAREDPARRQEAVIGERAGERRLPLAPRLGRLGLGRGVRHAPPAVLDGDVDGRAVGPLQPVFHVPNLV